MQGECDLPVLGVPAAGTAVQGGDLLWLRSLKLHQEHITKESMEAKPVAPVIQRFEKEVGLVELAQQGGTVGLAGNGRT